LSRASVIRPVSVACSTASVSHTRQVRLSRRSFHSATSGNSRSQRQGLREADAELVAAPRHDDPVFDAEADGFPVRWRLLSDRRVNITRSGRLGRRPWRGRFVSPLLTEIKG
jgi:hypothetical protein